MVYRASQVHLKLHQLKECYPSRKNDYVLLSVFHLTLSYSAALVGVLGLTGVCKIVFFLPPYYIILNFDRTTVLSLRAIGERAHVLHPVASFSSLCVLITASRYAYSVLAKEPSHSIL